MSAFLGTTLSNFCLIIGWFSLTIAIIYTFLIFMACVQMDEMVKRIMAHYNLEGDDDKYFLKAYFLSMVCVSFVVNVIAGTAAVYLILGINKGSTDYIHNSLTLMTINVVFTLISICCHILRCRFGGSLLFQIWILLVQCLILFPPLKLHTEMVTLEEDHK